MLMSLTRLEQKMLESGYNAFDLEEKNQFIRYLASRKGVPVNQISEDDILQYHKDMKISRMDTQCKLDIYKGFTASNGHFYRTNQDDQTNMLGQMMLLNMDPTITEVLWKTEDAGYIKHTREEWLKVYSEAFQHKQNLIFKFNELKTKILAAKTHEDILPLDWETYTLDPSPEEPEPDKPEEETPVEPSPEEPPSENPGDGETPINPE